MQIPVECPDCGTLYHLNPETIGKKMRCTNPMCQEIFEIRAKEEIAAPPPPPVAPVVVTPRRVSPPTPPPPKPAVGNVGDFVPVLDVEIPDAIDIDDDEELIRSLELNTPKPAKSTSPPPAAPRETQWSPDVEPPTEVEWSDEQSAPSSPSARKSKKVVDPFVASIIDDEPAPAATSSRSRDGEDDLIAARRSRRKKRRGMAIFTVLLLSVIGMGGYAAYTLSDVFRNKELMLAEAADATYEKGDYNAAVVQYDRLIKEYPQSNQLARYQFFQELSTLRKTVYSVITPSDPQPAIEAVQQFEKSHTDHPLLAPEASAVDFYETVQKLTEDVVGYADKRFQAKKYDESDQALEQAEELFTLAMRYKPQDVSTPRIPDEIARVRTGVAAARHYEALLARLEEMAQQPTEASLVAMADMMIAEKIDRDAKAMAIMQIARGNFQKQIKYIADQPPIASSWPKESNLSGLLVVPQVERSAGVPAGTAPGTGAVFFALARGVLYALDEVDGRPLWATRVGIDMDTLPLHIVGSETSPELVITPVNDGRQAGISARLARSGQPLWYQPLDAPALGKPVLFGQRVFVPTRDDRGTIAVIEIATGSRLGVIRVNQRLGVGGAKHPEKGILFFPAEGNQVFVFDVDKHNEEGIRLDPQPIGILPSGHPPRSLRGPAIVLGNELQNQQPNLLLMQADGLNRMKLRTFPLPPPDAPTPWAPIASTDTPLDGWTWFNPFTDGEKLALITERGDFGLFGIQQPGNQDPPLFPLPAKRYRFESGRLVELNEAPSNYAGFSIGRGQVVYADENRFWVVANGNLHQVELGISPLLGPKLVERGFRIPIGTPLHEGQVNPRRDLALAVTQSMDTSVCLATAIDLTTGKPRWVRQLGTMPQGEALALNDGVVLLDQSGGLFWFPPFTKPFPPEVEWQADEYWQVAAPIRDISAPPTLLRESDGQSVIVVAASNVGKLARLMIRPFKPGQPVETQAVPLPFPPAGAPVLLDGYVLIPLRDGNLYRVKLSTGKNLEAGPTWRSERASESADCHLTVIGPGDFLATNGDRSLIARRWPSDQSQFETRWQINTLDKIVRPALVLPKANAESPFRAVIADSKGAILLYEGDRLERLARAWRPAGANPIPGGAITSGPFLRQLSNDGANTLRIGHIVNNDRLIWIDPDADGPRWVYNAPGMVAEPLAVGNRLQVASGDRVVSLDGFRGEVVSSEALPFGIVPASAPVPIRTMEGLATILPLTDGTITLLSSGRPEPKKE